MYPVTIVPHDLSFDKLLIKKLACDHAVDVNERVFALAQAGICEDGFYARIQSFECNPSEVTLKFVFANGDRIVEATVNERAEATLLANGVPHPLSLTSYLISGEDLQGEYWGAVVVLPLAWLEEKLNMRLVAGATLSGNFIRTGKAVSAAFPELGTFIIE